MRSRIGLLVLASALLLSGCGGGDPAKPATKQIDINPKPVAQLRAGGDLRWPVSKIASQFNYYQESGPDSDAGDVFDAVMPYLFRRVATGGTEPNPNYLVAAESDGRTATYKLNPKAVWQDGSPFGWQDFDAQVKAMNGSNPAFVTNGNSGYSDITKVERGADDHEVKVTFAKPIAEWHSLFNPLYPRSTMSDPVVFNTGWADHPLTSGGPFRFEAADRVAGTLTLAPNEKWWGDRPRLSRIIFRAVARDSQVQSFINGDLDWISASATDYGQVAAAPNSAVRSAPSPGYRLLTVNGAPGALLADQRLRVAVLRGIDRTTLIRSQFAKLAPDLGELNNHFNFPGTRYYQDDSGPLAVDPAAAGRSLDELGWKPGSDGRRAKDGKPLTVRMVVQAGDKAYTDEAKLVQDMLGKIGVTVQLTTVPAGQYYRDYVEKGDFDLAGVGWSGSPNPVQDASAIYLSGEAGARNYGKIGSPEIDALFAKAATEVDEAKRAALLNQADHELFELGHSLPLFQKVQFIAVRSNLANFGAFGFGETDYAAIGFTS
ncbi:ABC transporter family substrate-binding protein [Pseudonocardiaceae bacterium YIM PH 21723]|nr:ABC transporter family substrate-binding protein [Pseudonocardiaceae bacterium YIM PH 21723]